MINKYLILSYLIKYQYRTGTYFMLPYLVDMKRIKTNQGNIVDETYNSYRCSGSGSSKPTFYFNTDVDRDPIHEHMHLRRDFKRN